MKRPFQFLFVLLVLLVCGCGAKQPGARVAKEAVYDARQMDENVWSVKDVATGQVRDVAKVDLTPLGLSMEEQVRARQRVIHGKARCRGTIREVGDPAALVLFVTALEDVQEPDDK